MANRTHSPNKGNDIDGGRVVGVSEKVHENMYNARRDLGEFDSARVDALDEELAVFQVLWEEDVMDMISGNILHASYLVKVLFEGVSKLLLEEKDHLLDVATGDHFEGDADGLALDLHIGTRRDGVASQ